jgi:hypothetical protein
MSLPPTANLDAKDAKVAKVAKEGRNHLTPRVWGERDGVRGAFSAPLH